MKTPTIARRATAIVVAFFYLAAMNAQDGPRLARDFFNSPDADFFKGCKYVPFVKEPSKKVDPKSKIGLKMKDFMFEDGRGMMPDYTKLDLKKYAIISVSAADYTSYENKGGPKNAYSDYTISLKTEVLDSIHTALYEAVN